MTHHSPNAFHAICFVMFFLGQFIHAWAQARELIRAKTNGVTNYAQYLDYRGPEVLARFFGCYLVYAAWQTGLLATLIGDWIPGAEAFMAAHPHPIPFNHITAGAFGFIGDYVLKGLARLLLKNPLVRAGLAIAGIKNQLPPPTDNSAADRGSK